MFRFANDYFLYGLIAIPFILLLYVFVYQRRTKRLALMGDVSVINGLVKNRSIRKLWFRFIVWLLAISFIILGLARPQFGTKLEKVKRKGIDLIIALDVSFSMNATDIQPSRIEKAKQAIARITDRLTDDSFGLIVFAGDAYTQIPITTDYASARMFLPSISTNSVPSPGTAIGKAIDVAMRSFSVNDERKKVIVVVTDGEDHEQAAVEAAARAAEKGVIVHTIGLGLPQGSPIPLGGADNFLRDRQGQVVVSKLNEPLLQEIAQSGNGIYVRANNAEVGLNQILDDLEKMDRSKSSDKEYTRYNEQFFWFFIAALLLVVAETFTSEKKTPWIQRFKNSMATNTIKLKIGLFLLLFSTSTQVFAQTERSLISKGNHLYKEKQFSEAEIAYRKAADINKNSFASMFNTGTALYKRGEYKQAAEWYEKNADKALTAGQAAKLYHNLGNAYFQTGKYKESLDAYKKALKLKPHDIDTKYNLSEALRKMQQQKNNNQPSAGNNNEKNKQSPSKDDKQEKKQEQQKQGISKDDADRMLNALQNEENRTRDKMQKQIPQQRRNVEKYW
jgi:Ca-activated chloride channel family protein